MFGALPKSIVLDPKVTPLEKTVLLALAVHADKQGQCYPSQRALSERLGVSRKSVTRAIGSLRHKQLLLVEERRRDGDNGRTSSLYTLNFKRFDDLSQGRDILSQGGVEKSQGQGHIVPPHRTPVSQQEQNQLTKTKELKFKPIVDSYKKHLPQMSQPRASSLKGTLGRKLARRWKEQPDADWWDKLFKCVAQDEWYSGQGSWSGATLRWLAEPKNLEKAEERFHKQLTSKSQAPAQQALPSDPYEAAIERERRRNPHLEGSAEWEMFIEDTKRKYRR